MKILVVIYLLIFQVSAFSNEQISLTSKNLTLLGLKYSSPEILSEYIMSEVKSKHTKQYFKVRKNPKELELLIKKVKDNLDLSLSKISREQLFKHSVTIKYDQAKEKSLTVKLNNLFPNITHSIFRSYEANNGFPDYFKLLLANLEIFNNIEINELMLNKTNQNLIYVDMTYVIKEYQNQQYFQTVIRNIKLYANKKRTLLIGEIEEKREGKEIMDNWLLSEGISTNLVGIHAFSVLGYRLQDEIRKSHVLKGVCEKAYKVDEHRVIICKQRYSKNLIIMAIYIGGILAQMDIIAESGITQEERSMIIRGLSQGLNNNKSQFAGKQNTWTNYTVNFNFDPLGFDFVSSQELNNKFKLVFSMSSQSTNKIFEGNK